MPRGQKRLLRPVDDEERAGSMANYTGPLVQLDIDIIPASILLATAVLVARLGAQAVQQQLRRCHLSRSFVWMEGGRGGGAAPNNLFYPYRSK